MYFQPSLDPEVIGMLGEFLLNAEIRAHYDTVVLIGHSQGGIVAKLYVIEEILKNRASQLKVEMIITVCTPHFGPRWPYALLLDCLSALDRLPLVRLVLPYKQVLELGRNGPHALRLRDYWRPPFVYNPVANRSVLSGHALRSVALVGRRDPWVSGSSAGGASAVDELRWIDCGHSISPSELQQPFFECLDEHQKPVDVLRQISTLNEGRTFERYLNAYKQTVEGAVRGALEKGNRPAPLPYVSAVASAMMSDFPREFARRPMRKLTFEESLVRYVTRRVEAT
jgi:pimeloyl-ACP methyl ester carboxylesterase